MCAELMTRVRAKLTTAHRVRAALQDARRRIEGDAEAAKEIDQLIARAREREDLFARLAKGLKEGRYAHVEDIVLRYEEAGWVIARRRDDPWECDLCGGHRIRHVMQAPSGERRVVVGCANLDCGFGYDTDYAP